MGIKMKSTKTAKVILIALTVAALTLATTTLAAININRDVTSSGTITTTPNISVYSDSACTQNLTGINWGSIEAGGSTSRTIFVKNTGTGTVTLSLASNNWTPSEACSYITISWNSEETQLSSGQLTSATLTLTVASSITAITTFSNTFTISGTV